MTEERKGRKKGAEIHTIHPADGQRLEDGEEQQAGSTAGEMVIDLEHIQTTLHTKGDRTPLVHVVQNKTGSCAQDLTSYGVCGCDLLA